MLAPVLSLRDGVLVCRAIVKAMGKEIIIARSKQNERN